MTGEARFSVPKGNSGMGRLTHDEMQPEKEHTDGFHTLVKMVRADAVVPEGTEVAFMKVDVEGNEVYAIRSASKLIEEGRVHVMIAEFTFSGGFETVGTREILEFMYANGYAVASHAGNEKVQPFGGELRTLEDVVASFANIGQVIFFAFEFFSLHLTLDAGHQLCLCQARVV